MGLRLASTLLEWYHANARTLPWRAGLGETPNPYHVWLSEVMLQQTQVATVIPYFQTFISRWPTLQAFSQATLEEIFHAWQGLGYYRRAQSLQACAQVLIREYGGQFPREEKVLLTLPGLGPYSAAAIAAIAFEQPAVAIDGNILRVFSRVYRLDERGPKALREAVLPLATQALPSRAIGDYTQSLMDLGATLCKPKQPLCQRCPLQKICLAFREGNPEDFPKKVPKPNQPLRFGTVFWLENEQGEVFIYPQQDRALLNGLMTFPSTPWEETTPPAPSTPTMFQSLVEGAQGTYLASTVRHTFTHFKVELRLWKGRLCERDLTDLELPQQGRWAHPQTFSQHAFSTLMKKVATTFCAQGGL